MIWTIFLVVEAMALAFDIGVHLVHGRKPTKVIIIEDPASRARLIDQHIAAHERMVEQAAHGLDDPAVDEYVIRVGFVEGLNAGVSVIVGEPHDIVVPVNETEEASLRGWLDELVLNHPEAF